MKNDIKYVFFDLDNTLLPIDQDKFFENYVKILSDALPGKIDERKKSAGILAGGNAMYDNCGIQSNEKAFWEGITKELGTDVLEYTDDFYRVFKERYPTLQKFTHKNKIANIVIEMLKNSGYDLLIATDPIMPQFAQKLRTKWAGLEADDFLMITSYENFHYCKPKTEYYQEILDKLKISAEKCIMVGNDIGNDMIASKIGLDIFLITQNLCSADKSHTNCKSGSLTDFCDFMLK